MSNQNPYSLESFLGFIQSNFSLLVVVGLFFLGGFFFGSVWTENKMIKSGGAAAPSVAGSAAAPAGAPAAAPDFSDTNLITNAVALGVDEAEFQACITGAEASGRVTAQMDGGSAAGVSGTPHSIIMLDGVPVDVIGGAQPYDEVVRLIEGRLNGTLEVNPEAGAIPAIGSGDYITGNASGRLAIVEYSDFSCGFCQRFHPTMKQVMAEYGDEVAWVYRHYPFLGPASMSSAIAADCVGSLAGNDAFWQYTDTLMSGV